MLLTTLPALFMFALFWSLAFHMHRSLGGWTSNFELREDGFPAPLITHAHIVEDSFTFFLLSLAAWPLAFIVFLLVPRCRRLLAYLGLYAVSGLACVVAMALAPSQFLHWWWDW
jgi:hypothetical protein